MNVQLRSVSPSWRARTPAVVLSSYQIEVTLANHFKWLQLTGSAYLKVGMSLTGHRYGLWKYACFWPLHTTSIIVSPRLSGRILSKNSLCARTVCLWHNIIYCALYYNAWQGRRKQEAKFFSVFALSFGVFYRLLRSRWKPIQSYQCFEFYKAMMLTSKILYHAFKNVFL